MDNRNVGMGSVPTNAVVENPREAISQLLSLEGKLEGLQKSVLSVYERFEFFLSPVPPKDISQDTKMPSVSSLSQRMIACNVILSKELDLLKELLERSEI
jgi:hypothetical protein